MPEIQEKVIPQRVILRIITAVFFAAAFSFYALVIFGLLPFTQNTPYSRAAENHKSGKMQPEELLDFSPLYLQVHVNAARLFGRSAHAVQWLHISLTALSICIFFRILLRFFPLWLSVAGSIAFLMQRSLIISTQALEPESLIVFFLMAFLYFVGSTSRKAHLFAGIFLGLIVMTRPDYALLIVFIPMYFLMAAPQRRIALTSTFLCAAPAITALAAVWIRQAMIIGYFSWRMFIPGNAIYEGNNPVSSGLSPVYPPIVEEISGLHPNKINDRQKIYRQFARSITGLNLTSPEADRYWSFKAIQFLQDHPRHTVALLANKVFYFFHDYQWHELPATFENEMHLRESGIPAVPFCVLSALGIAGLWLGKKRWREWLFIYVTFLFQFLFMMILYVSEGFRAPIIPLFVFFALAAIYMFITEWKKLFWLIVVLPAVWFFHTKTDLMDEETNLLRGTHASNRWIQVAYQKRGADQWIEASEAAARSLSAAPFFLDSRRPSSLPFETGNFFVSGLTFVPTSTPQNLFNRGFLSLYANLAGQAEIAMREAQISGWHFKRDQYQSSQPSYYLGCSSWMRGNKKEAESRFREALKQSPGDPWSLAALYAVTRDNSFRMKLFWYFDDIDAHFFLGEAALELGNAEAGVNSFSYVVHQIPEYRRARIFLAAALANAERLDEAEGVYRTALQMSSDPVMREKEILALFRKLSERSPDNPEHLYMYGFVLRQFGHYEEAFVVQQQALEKSQAPAIRAEIAALQNVLSQLAASD